MYPFELSQMVFPPGQSPAAMERLFRQINRKQSLQATAATATLGFWVAEFAGKIQEVELGLAVLPASGESMVFDVRKNGSTILTAAFTANPTTATAKRIDLSHLLSPSLSVFSEGDLFTVVRTYTAGGGPAMTYSQVTVYPGVLNL